MQKTLLVVFATALIAVSFGATVNSSLTAFMQRYTGNATLALLYANSTSGIAIVGVNNGKLAVSLNPYSLVTNKSMAFGAFRGYLLGDKSYNSSLLSSLAGYVTSMRSGTRPAFAQCLSYTGLNSTYLPINSSKGCLGIAACSQRYSNATIGPVLGTGIVNFSKRYNIFNSSYNSFEDIISKVNRSNYFFYAGQLAQYASSMAAVPYALLHNPLFSVPSNFSSNLYTNCPYFPSASTLESAPWYCSMLSFCQNIPFSLQNASKLQGIASQLESIPSDSAISSAADNAASLAQSYLQRAGAGNQTLFIAFLGKSATLISSARNLSKKVSDPTLFGLFLQLNSSESAFQASYYTTLNATERSLSPVLAQMQSTYSNLSSRYSELLGLSASADAALLSAQLSSPGSTQLAQLTSMARNITAQLSGRVNSADFQSIRANLTAIAGAASALSSPASLGAFVKAADSWFINPIISSMNENSAAKAASAPFYAALLSLIIGSIAVLFLYRGTYYRYTRVKKSRLDKKVKRSWEILFLVAIIAVVIYAAATYAFAVSANSALPLSGFTSRLASSSSVIIALDSGLASSQQVNECVATLKGSLQSQGKLVTEVATRGALCSSGNATSDCLNQFMADNMPIILIENTTTSYRGIYGYVLYANESYSSGPACALSGLLK